jgi:MoxR-like ATPase
MSSYPPASSSPSSTLGSEPRAGLPTEPFEPTSATLFAQASDPSASVPGPVGYEDHRLRRPASAEKVVERLRARVRAAVRGRDEVIDLVIIALLADGHVLLEDYPGSGKTTLAKALGDSIVDDDEHDAIAAMRRIQFTPDMLPSDLTGTTVFDPNTNTFSFRPGPVFAHVVLADEINRTSPKVQAALLEAMAEKQVTVDNETRPLGDLFFVIATQNPLDLAGTFPLPAAQLDRFLFKIRMVHVAAEAELEILASLRERRDTRRDDLARVTRGELIAARRTIEEKVHVDPAIHELLVEIAQATRSDRRILLGTSTRSLVLALPALQARAFIEGRSYVSPEDVEYLAPLIFAHRIEAAPGIDDAAALVRDCCKEPFERAARRFARGL